MTSPVGSSGAANWVCGAVSEDDVTKRQRRMIVIILFWILANFMFIFFSSFQVHSPAD